MVSVEEIDGARCRISEPCQGWVSFYSIAGETKLQKTREDIIRNKVRRRVIKASDVEYPDILDNDGYNLVADCVMVEDNYHNPECADIDLNSNQ